MSDAGNEITITQIELVKYPGLVRGDQLLLTIMQDKGAPVIGKFMKKLDLENYEYVITDNPDHSHTISWTPRKPLP